MNKQHTPTQAEEARRIAMEVLAAGGTQQEMLSAINAYHARLDAEQAAADTHAREAHYRKLRAPLSGNMIRNKR